MNRINIFLVVLLSCLSAEAQSVFTLGDVIHRAQTESPTFRRTETTRETSYWQYRYYRSNYNPQIRMQDNGGQVYRKSITKVIQPNGSIEYLPLNQVNPGVNFYLSQPLQWTNGTISVNSSYNYFKDYIGNTSQWNGNPVFIQLNQPLLGFNKLKWDRLIQPIKYEESKRDYAEGMEDIAQTAAMYFFNVLDAQVNLQIAKFNLANNDTIYKIEQGRYNIGTTSEDKLLQVELQLLRSKQDVSQANLDLQNYSLRLRAFIGLRTNEPLNLALPDTIPLVTVYEDEALEHARATRSAYIAFERRKIESKQIVANARGNLYQVGINAAYGLNTVGGGISDLYRTPSKQQFATISFDVPILDWGRRRAAMKTAYAQQKLNDYTIAQDESNFEQEIITEVRKFDILYLQLEITKKSDEVALKRYNVAQNRYLIGKIDITNLNIALTEKDKAKRDYISALRLFWTEFYFLRKLTLYDFMEKKYLYNPHEN